MTTLATHSHAGITALRAVRSGRGGQILVVTDEPRRGARFYGGLRRAPAQTLLEAVLAFVGDQPGYERILLFTGVGSHLPHGYSVGAEGFVVGQTPFGWLMRGAASAASFPSVPAGPPTAEPETFTGTASLKDRFAKRHLQKSTQAGQPGHILDRLQGEWPDQVQKILRHIETECGWEYESELHRAKAKPTDRALIVLDEAVLTPAHEDISAVMQLGASLKQRLETRLNKIPELLRNTPVDLIFLAQSPASAESLREGTMIHDQIVAQNMHQNVPHQVDRRLPCMSWPDVAVARLGIDPQAPFTPFFPHSKPSALSDILQSVPPLKTLASRLRPASDPTTVDLKFWSVIDVDGLDKRLRRDVIGQRHVITKVVEAFAEFRETCNDAIRANRRLPAKTEYFPPTFMFMGESGMGKTHVARIIADFLFGDQFFELIKLTQKSASDELIGVQMAYVGCEEPRLLFRYCDRTGGLGLVVFDELDKVMRPPNSDRLDQAVSPFLGILEERSVVPNNPTFARAGGRIHFANSVVVFTANVMESGQRPGYERLEDFGGPFQDRVPFKLAFGAMESEDIEPAVQFFLAQYSRQLLEDVFQDGQVSFAPNLIAQLAKEFDSLSAGMTSGRSFRTLKDEFLKTRLPQRMLKGKFRRNDLNIGPDDLQGQWRPSMGAT